MNSSQVASFQKTILYIGNKLSKHGYTITNIETLGPQLGQYYRVLTVSDKKNKLLRLLEMILLIIKNKKADILIIDTYSTQGFMFARIAGSIAYKMSIPYIPILHGGDLPKMLKKATPLQLEYFRKAAKLVAPSPYLFQQFQQFGFQRLSFIPNNIDLKQYKFTERNSLQPRLLWVRSFHQMYNPNMALQVMRQLLSEYPNAKLCMVGPDKDGSLERAKRVAANYNITDKVVFKGKMDKAEWHLLSKEYDIFINTTTIDNTPVSVIEALALGMPVISTNVGGIPYLLKHEVNALLVQSANAEEMTGEVMRLLNQPELAKRLAGAGRELAKSFNWEVVKYKWFELFDEVAGK